MSSGYFTRKQRGAADEYPLAEIALQPAQFVLDHRRATGLRRARAQHPHLSRTGCCRACPAAARTKTPKSPRPACLTDRAWAAGPGGRLQPRAFPASGSAPTTTGRRCCTCAACLLPLAARPAASPGRRGPASARRRR